VTLNKGALACKQPSDELDRIAIANEADQKVLFAKLSARDGCHDSSAFIRNDSWQVEETIGTQLGVKMRGYVGKYWVSLAQVSLLHSSSVSNTKGEKRTVSLAPVTVEEWRKSFSTAYEQSGTKKSDDGLTNFMAVFQKKVYAFGKYDAFAKTYVFTPMATQLYGDLTTNIRFHVLVGEGRLPVIALSPQYVNRDGEGILGIQKVAILVDDELVFEKEFNASDVKRTPLGAAVAESAYTVLSESEADSLRRVRKESQVVIRVTGREGYVNLKKQKSLDPIEWFKTSVMESLYIYDGINKATDGHMPEKTISAL
jgi:hypothetical protein